MRRAADHERAGPQLDQGCKNCVEVAFGAHMQDMDLQPEGASCRPQVFRGGLGELRTSRVDEQSNDGLRRDQLVQQLEPLGRKLGIYRSDAGDVIGIVRLAPRLHIKQNPK
jgi:hypothetical protein